MLILNGLMTSIIWDSIALMNMLKINISGTIFYLMRRNDGKW